MAGHRDYPGGRDGRGCRSVKRGYRFKMAENTSTSWPMPIELIALAFQARNDALTGELPHRRDAIVIMK
jgi:hypothetical protein